MRTRPTILFYSPDALPGPGPGAPVGRRPTPSRCWSSADPDEVEAIVLRGHPCLLFVDGDGRRRGAASTWSAGSRATPSPPSCRSSCSPAEHHAEQVAGLVRGRRGRGHHRDLLARPSSGPGSTRCWCAPSGTSRCIRPPGCRAPPRSSGRSGAGWSRGQEFAVCYADLDHFKEFNDRYSYYDGDRVIYLLSRILHDVVKGLLGADGLRRAHRRRRLHLHHPGRARSARSAARSSTCSTR